MPRWGVYSLPTNVVFPYLSVGVSADTFENLFKYAIDMHREIALENIVWYSRGDLTAPLILWRLFQVYY